MIAFCERVAPESTAARSASARLGLVAAVIAALAVALVGMGGVAAADPGSGSALACAGDGDGAIFEADSGLQVAYNASAPMPDGGDVFPDGETVAVRNVTLSSAGASSTALDAATNETACLSAVNATPAPVTVDRDDGRAVVLDGEVEAITLAADDDGEALVTLSANATGAFELTIEEAGVEGDELELLESNGDAPEETTVDENRSARFTVPGGTHTLTVQSASDGGRSGGIGGGGGGGAPGGLPPTPPSTPASFALSAFEVSPTTVAEGEPVTATVTVTNDGGEHGTYAVELTIGGESAATETVDLDAGASESVGFEHAFAEAGEYEVGVGGEAATVVTVEPAATTDEAGAVDGTDPEDSGRSLGVVAAVVAVAAVALLGVAIGARRWLDRRP